MSKKLSADELDGGKLWLAWYGLISLAREGPATRKQLFLAGPEAKKFVNNDELNAILSKASWQKQYANALVESGICCTVIEENKQIYKVANEELLHKILAVPPQRGNQYLNCLMFPSRYGTLVRWLEAEQGAVSLEEEGETDPTEELLVTVSAVPAFVQPPEPVPLFVPGEEPVTVETLEMGNNTWLQFKDILNAELNVKFNTFLEILSTSTAFQHLKLEALTNKLDSLIFIANKNKSLLEQFQKDVLKLQGDTDVAKDLRACIDNAQAFTSLATDVLSKLDGK